jgi:hypothetical protein
MSAHAGGKKCGPHVELISNEAARVTRCTCGTVHVTLHTNAMTFVLPAEKLRHVANALSGAVRLIDLTDKAGEASGEQVN